MENQHLSTFPWHNLEYSEVCAVSVVANFTDT